MFWESAWGRFRCLPSQPAATRKQVIKIKSINQSSIQPVPRQPYDSCTSMSLCTPTSHLCASPATSIASMPHSARSVASPLIGDLEDSRKTITHNVYENCDLVSSDSFSSRRDSSSDDAWSCNSSSRCADCVPLHPSIEPSCCPLPNKLGDSDMCPPSSGADLGDEDSVATLEDLDDDCEGHFYDWCDELEAHASKSHGHSIHRALRNKAGE
jgi:hypothetical protein